MVIAQFRKLSPVNIGLLVILGVLLCVGVMGHLPAKLETTLVGPAIFNLVPSLSALDLSPGLNVAATLILTLLQAFYINAILNRHNFFGKPGFLVALMYLTLASLTLPFLVLSPVLLSNFLLIWMLDKLLKIYHRPTVLNDLFDLGLIVAVGSLLYLPFIACILLVYSGLRLFRPFSWREWLAPIIGLVTVYFMVWVIYFWFDQQELFLRLWTPVTEPSVAPIRIDRHDYLIIIPVLLILALFLVTLRQTIFKRLVHIRRSVQLLFIFLLVAVASYFFETEPKQDITHFLMAVPPLSIYAAYYFHYAASRWVYETVYGLLVCAIILAHLL